MIDFTTIQTFPIPESIAFLKKTNQNLSEENKLIRNMIIAMVIGGVIYIGYNYYIKQKENESRKTNDNKGNKK